MTQAPPTASARTGLGAASDRTLAVVVYTLSAVVCGLVLIFVTFPQLLVIDGLDVSRLPAFHAILNGATAVLLLAGYLLVRSGKVAWHRGAMVSAFSLSCLFLISYLIYHSQAVGSEYGGLGWMRWVYFFVLISHISLAPIVLPLALYAVVRAVRGEFMRHRKVARWTFPLWFYVAVTGVVVYLMMAPYYSS